jgi:hypothetical protein
MPPCEGDVENRAEKHRWKLTVPTYLLKLFERRVTRTKKRIGRLLP